MEAWFPVTITTRDCFVLQLPDYQSRRHGDPAASRVAEERKGAQGEEVFRARLTQHCAHALVDLHHSPEQPDATGVIVPEVLLRYEKDAADGRTGPQIPPFVEPLKEPEDEKGKKKASKKKKSKKKKAGGESKQAAQ